MTMEKVKVKSANWKHGIAALGVFLISAFVVAPAGWAQNNPNLDLERHYDTIFGAKLPMLGDAINHVLSRKNAYLSTNYDPYTAIWSQNPDMVSGVVRSGDVYSIKLKRLRSRVTAVFRKNGVQTYRLKLIREMNSKSGLELHSVLSNIMHPAYKVKIDVYKGKGMHNGIPDALLKIRFAGREVTETVWPGKKRFKNIGRLVSMLSSLPGYGSKLHNYFYLITANSKYAAYGWRVLDEFPAPYAHERIKVPGHKRDSREVSKPRSISGGEAYWCGVGTMGADVVFTLAGSFFYGAVCGGLAEAS